MNLAYDYKKLEIIGKDTFEILTQAKEMVKPGVKMLDVAKKIEELVQQKKLQSAFPVNLSINENAAHYTPIFDDKTVFTDKDVVKIDIGLRDGDSLTDCAMTVDLTNKHSKLMQATQE